MYYLDAIVKNYFQGVESMWKQQDPASQPTITNELELVSVPEAARILSLSPWTIRAHVKRKSIMATRCGRRVLVPKAEIARIRQEGLPSLHSD